MIQVDNISKTFTISKKRPGLCGSIQDLFHREYIKKVAVKGVSFHIEKGELVGYIGRNGAGKSTTIKMLCGVLYPDQGQILVNGIVPHENRRKNNLNIGVVFGQRGQLWRDLAVQDSFTLIKKIYEVDELDYKKRIDILNEVLEIKELMPLPVRKLSLGQRMRCELAAALVHWPTVLYLDEPTIGVDLLTRKKILQFVKYLNEEFRTTVILTTHNMQDIETLCDRIILIDKGTIIFDDERQKLKQMYAGHKKIIINFQNSIKFAEKEFKNNIPDSVHLITQSEKELVLLTTINSDLQIVTDVINQATTMQTVQDYEVLLPKLEDIIETIYERVSL